ncbi:hypothetical protein AXG93_1247s1170 [Marchantia polymorpha subsp. ruderalis]|uniref:Uncharacterized protein n=1 Tax=Marchantia polymorpha subsp. ruderalis TaxID=1480154 RepID=A0A176WPV0_MARPO|nr:hypothetical protein AXG93_1247s1170 [Marchantia polymorpha subsp. ruderalis]
MPSFTAAWEARSKVNWKRIAYVIMPWWIDVPYVYGFMIFVFVRWGISVLLTERVRSWYARVGATNGGVHNDVERSLREDLKYSKDDIDAIRSSTSVQFIYYCQSAFASTGSCRWAWQRESARPAPLPVLPHHDFAVLRLKARNSEGKLLQFFISAEKEGRGQGGGTPGIYIHLLTRSAFRELRDNHNIIYSWKGYSIQVPLGDLTTTLEGHDTNYNLLNNNCWRYAKAACRSVILLLSQQPGVNPEQKQLLLKSSRMVSYTVTKKAIKKIGDIVFFFSALHIFSPFEPITAIIATLIAFEVKGIRLFFILFIGTGFVYTSSSKAVAVILPILSVVISLGFYRFLDSWIDLYRIKTGNRSCRLLDVALRIPRDENMEPVVVIALTVWITVLIWTSSVTTPATLEAAIAVAVYVGIKIVILTGDKIGEWLNTWRSRPDRLQG